MNPNSGETPKFEMPHQPAQAENLNDKRIEATPVTPENTAQARQLSGSAQSATAIALPSNVTAQTFSDDTATKASASHTPHDSERIDKQLVDKAKAILANTRDDPYQQKVQIGKVKAEYIKNRFNKTIKTDDTVTK